MTCVFFVGFNLKICISSTPLTLHFKYKYILTTNWFYIMYIMHSRLLSHKHEQLFVKDTFSKFIIFKVKSTFEPNVSKLVRKTIFISGHKHGKIC
jgi:hypothetical protein